MRRSFLPISIIISILFAIILKNWEIATLSFIAYIFPTILDILNFIIFKKGKDTRFIYAHKSFIQGLGEIKASIIRGILEISFLPHKAYTSLSSIIKTIYRMKVSKKHLLEWLTAEQAEKQAKTDLVSYYKFMWMNLVFGVLSLVFGIIAEKISQKDKEYLIEIGKKTWQYFKDNINEENNFLAPDNYQEDRVNKVARKNINNKYRSWNAFSNFCI